MSRNFRTRNPFHITLEPDRARDAEPPALSMADPSTEFRKGLSFAIRIGVDLVSALIAGGAVGYLADWYFNSQPVGILIGVFLGMSAGLLHVYRTVSRL